MCGSLIGVYSLRLFRKVAVFVLAAVCFMTLPQDLSAQVEKPKERYPWAEKMFETLEHDFGVIARGADAHYRIEFTNIYEEEVNIQQVSASCGCTLAEPSSRTLAKGETAYIDVSIDTRKYLNDHTSIVTVIFDQPLFGEVSIEIKTYIRSDVVLSPGMIEFGATIRGEKQEQKLTVSYAGREDWKIKEVICKNESIAIELKETSRADRRVKYELLVTLKPDAPLGELRDQIVLVTDDAISPELPILIEGQVGEAFVVKPDLLDFGTQGPGAVITRNIVVKGKDPLRIVSIKSEKLGKRMRAKLAEDGKIIHIIPVTIEMPLEVGRYQEAVNIQIEDLEKPLSFKVQFRVSKPK